MIMKALSWVLILMFLAVSVPSDADAMNPLVRRTLTLLGSTWVGSKLSDGISNVEAKLVDAYEAFEDAAVDWYIRPYTDAQEEREGIGDYYICPSCNGSYTGSHQCGSGSS